MFLLCVLLECFDAGIVNPFYDGMLLWWFRMQCHGLVVLPLLRIWRLSRDRMFKQRTRKHKNGCVDDVIARGPSIIWRLIVVQEVVTSVNVQFLKFSCPTAELSVFWDPSCLHGLDKTCSFPLSTGFVFVPMAFSRRFRAMPCNV